MWNKRFKTELCRNFQIIGQCHMMDRCAFAHGELELRDIQDNLQFEDPIPPKKRVMCKYFLQGYCKYEEQCQYHHGPLPTFFMGGPMQMQFEQQPIFPQHPFHVPKIESPPPLSPGMLSPMLSPQKPSTPPNQMVPLMNSRVPSQIRNTNQPPGLKRGNNTDPASQAVVNERQFQSIIEALDEFSPYFMGDITPSVIVARDMYEMMKYGELACFLNKTFAEFSANPEDKELIKEILLNSISVGVSCINQQEAPTQPEEPTKFPSQSYPLTSMGNVMSAPAQPNFFAPTGEFQHKFTPQ